MIPARRLAAAVSRVAEMVIPETNSAVLEAAHPPLKIPLRFRASPFAKGGLRGIFLAR